MHLQRTLSRNQISLIKLFSKQTLCSRRTGHIIDNISLRRKLKSSSKLLFKHNLIPQNIDLFSKNGESNRINIVQTFCEKK